MYVDVAVCLPLTRTFVYKSDEPVKLGCRLVVPFRKRQVEGFAVAIREKAPDIEILPVKEILDRSPLLRPDVFALCRWISDYYVSPLGEVLKAALPPGISAKHFEREGPLPPGEGGRRPGEGSRDASRHSRPHPPLRGTLSRRERDLPLLLLTSDQSRALDAIRNTNGFHPVLLHGVTGSGKTEVYMRMAEHCLSAGKSSLILVPEIGLTPQLADRFAERFAGKIAVLHSSLTKRQRIDEWLRIYTGQAQLVIGTRSAVFAPLENIGLIVVDEEHETSPG